MNMNYVCNKCGFRWLVAIGPCLRCENSRLRGIIANLAAELRSGDSRECLIARQAVEAALQTDTRRGRRELGAK